MRAGEDRDLVERIKALAEKARDARAAESAPTSAQTGEKP